MSRQVRGTSVQLWIRWFAGIFFVLFLMVWEHVEALRLDRQVVSLQKEADRLTYENGKLQMQIHQWISPSHLDAMARQQYGMAPLDAAHVIDVQNPGAARR